MKLEDTKYLLGKIAAVDNRIITDETLNTWHEIVGHLSFEVAERALVKARQDQFVDWVEPRHIVAKARDAIIDLNEEARKLAREAEEDGVGAPEPICRPHGSRITECLDCCRLLADRQEKWPRADLHAWAVENLYVNEQVPF